MKKTRRLLCMLLVVVMLLGAIPAHAATPMTAAASLIALPLSGKLFAALPVSDSISKALSVESTYSTETKSAPTSAPVEQTTFAASPVRLADGTTGATVGTAGVTQTESLKGLYTSRKGLNAQTKQVSRTRKDEDTPLALTIDYSKVTTANLVGVTIDADMLVDVYKFISGTGYTFVCQYDTHGTGPLTITMEPGASAATNAHKAPARASAVTAYTDVNPSDWYYDAVMAVSKGGMIHTVFDLDPNGSFKPNELLTGSEMQFVIKRLFGFETEGLIMSDSTASDTTTKTCGEHGFKLSNSSKATRLNVLNEIMARIDSYNVTPIAQTKTEISAADRNAIEGIARTVATDSQHGYRGNGFATYEENYAVYKNKLTRAGELNLVRTPGTPETIDFDARITRAELCVILYRAGMTEFGCCAATNLKK